jgi:hypothetical protein
MFAVDIESRLFPSSPPKNIQFRVESVTHLPAEWTAAFSLVHQRLLVAALQIREWPVALSEIYRVLRPGGWVQITKSIAWMEGENPDRPCMEKLITISRCLAKSRNIYADCARDIPKMLSEAGFVGIQSESRALPLGKWAGETGVDNRVIIAGAFRGTKTPILQAGGYGYVSSEEEYDGLLEGLEREWDEIPGTHVKFVTFCAKKPV